MFVTNNTTQEFYNYIINFNKNIKCIGFSATPTIYTKPFGNILSQYSILDALKDKVIVPPKINCSSQDVINYESIPYFYILKMPYRKIIVWCGLISHTEKLNIYGNDFFKLFN